MSILWDIFIRFIDLPISVEGVTVPNDDGTFDIYINQNLCPARQEQVKNHELNHILKNHFYNEQPVIYNEKDADFFAG